ncbi:MAG: diguanylate cyclase [Lachnospiraceae bacterium]|nr:diguanylate cyclase [Lachnospiraceae bacterium]
MAEKDLYFRKISEALLRDYTSVYYVDAVTNEYYWYSFDSKYHSLKLEPSGDDFFKNVKRDVLSVVYEEDQHMFLKDFTKEKLIKSMEDGSDQTMLYRIILDGKPVYHRLKVIRSVSEEEDYFILGVINVDKEIRSKKKVDKEHERSLKLANDKARRDELTGIKNANAYQEVKESIQNRINDCDEELKFALVVCDLNDLKHINDTKGHGVGDEYIQKTSHLICDVFDHSPVFRIGGDEFVAILNGRDYSDRDILLRKLREQVIENSRTKIGPIVASGIAVFDPVKDIDYSEVFNRADSMMYHDKKALKSSQTVNTFVSDKIGEELPSEKKKRLDEFFEAIYTLSDSDYVYLCDMKYDYSRWSLKLVDDFNMPSEYMYKVGELWQEYIHPDDVSLYKKAIDRAFSSQAKMTSMKYRARNKDGKFITCYTKGFVLVDDNGEPDYFGGAIYTDD